MGNSNLDNLSREISEKIADMSLYILFSFQMGLIFLKVDERSSSKPNRNHSTAAGYY